MMQPLASPDQLGLVSLGTIAPDAADELLTWASAEVRDYCDWHIAPPTQVVLYPRRGRGTEVLSLRVRNLTSPPVVVENGVTLVADTDYEWDDSGVLKRIGQCWPTALRAVQVTVTAGYDLIPPAVTAVVCALAARTKVTAGGVSSIRLGSLQIGDRSGGSTAAGVGFDPAELRILDRYAL